MAKYENEVFQRTGGLLWAIATQSKGKPGSQQRCQSFGPCSPTPKAP